MLGSSPFGLEQFSFRRLESEPNSIRVKEANIDTIQSYPLLIYEGSINYWRTRETIHLAVFEHQKISTVAPYSETSVCVEVVGFSPKLGVEAPHIFLSSEVLYEKFRKNENADSKLREQKNGQIVSRKNVVKCNNKFTIDAIRNYVLTRVGVLPNTESTRNSVSVAEGSTLPIGGGLGGTTGGIANLVGVGAGGGVGGGRKSPPPLTSISLEGTRNLTKKLSNLNLPPNSESGELLAGRRPSIFEIGFTPQLSDQDDGDVVLSQKPLYLAELPVVNPQARKEPEAIRENFEKEMLLFRADTSSISSNCEKAEKMSELAMNTIKIMEDMMALVLKKQEEQLKLQSLSIARKRWNSAIKKVLMQNKVRNMAAFIDEYYKKVSTDGFVFKMQTPKKQKPRKKEFSPDFQNNLTRIENEMKRGVNFREVKSEDNDEREPSGLLAMKVQPIARRKSLNPPEEVVRTLPIRDNLFSNLTRARRDPDAVSTVNSGNNGYSNGNNNNNNNDNRADSGGSGSNGRRGSGMGQSLQDKGTGGGERGERAAPMRRGSSQTNGSISSNEGDKNSRNIPSEKSDRSDKNEKTLKNDKDRTERPERAERPEKPIFSAKARAVRRGSFIAPPPVDGRKVSLPRLSLPNNVTDKVDRGDRGESKGEKNEKVEKVVTGERGVNGERGEKNEKHKETEVSQSVRLSPSSSLPAIKKEKEKERRKSIQL